MLILVHGPHCANTSRLAKWLAFAAPENENILHVALRPVLPPAPFWGVVILDNVVVKNTADLSLWLKAMRYDRKILVMLRPSALEPGVGVKELPGFDAVYTVTGEGDVETLARTIFK